MIDTTAGTGKEEAGAADSWELLLLASLVHCQKLPYQRDTAASITILGCVTALGPAVVKIWKSSDSSTMAALGTKWPTCDIVDTVSLWGVTSETSS